MVKVVPVPSAQPTFSAEPITAPFKSFAASLGINTNRRRASVTPRERFRAVPVVGRRYVNEMRKTSSR